MKTCGAVALVGHVAGRVGTASWVMFAQGGLIACNNDNDILRQARVSCESQAGVAMYLARQVTV